MTKTMLLLPGDGIGPEVSREAARVVSALTNEIEIDERPFGGASIDRFGAPLTDDTLAKALASDAVMMGAVGGAPGAWAHVARANRPEAGLLKLRKARDVFANLRPAICFPALADASTLKREVVAGLDIMIVRELTGGVYFGEPRGIETLPDGQRRGIDTQVYTTGEIERVARVAFDLARKRRGKVTSCEKSNVMESGALWREVVADLHRREYADLQLEHMLADNAAMQLVRRPTQFDVIVTDNLFGDILSDEAAMLTGSIGMLPSASLDANNKGLYEPSHGSAPDIAGKGIANPLA
ncbi:MAG TPA: 3-isopropylmalate dehydrogenase, partial [Caulobacterales bacterium]|nr:3-isopropylmalate dehydrogenase [Caulobacterales bacterium]